MHGQTSFRCTLLAALKKQQRAVEFQTTRANAAAGTTGAWMVLNASITNARITGETD
jgi:hypothetical protein